jgi:histidinol dehydrogenase
VTAATRGVAPPSTRLALRFTGAAAALSEPDRRAFLRRDGVLSLAVRTVAERIVADVRARGDAALLEMARDLDGVTLDALEVPRDALTRALEGLAPDLRRAMERSARNIETVHRAFAPAEREVTPEPGIVVGRRPDPLARVGVYAPGGRASYPSSVLMAAIPARAAGVREIILASPPGRSGVPAASVLAAAALSGVDRVFAIGGAGAIAAMAFGTGTIPRVDRIVGPGNAYVAAAKLAVGMEGRVAIDCPAGPSELLVIADAGADPAGVAMEMIAQAEHDPLACAVAIVVGDETASAIERELAERVDGTARREVVAQALAGQGGVLRAESLAAAIELANEYAPEHLLLAVDSAETLLPTVRNAGAVFVGAPSSVTFGDYMTGANHVLPTNGAARAWSGLSPLDFVRWTSYQRVSPRAARGLADDTATFADAERLRGHGDAARLWSARQ